MSEGIFACLRSNGSAEQLNFAGAAYTACGFHRLSRLWLCVLHNFPIEQATWTLNRLPSCLDRWILNSRDGGETETSNFQSALWADGVSPKRAGNKRGQRRNDFRRRAFRYLLP
jgi:hypothetical protein